MGATSRITVQIAIPDTAFRPVLEALVRSRGRLSRSEASGLAGLSPNRFSTVFHEVHGQTFAEARTEVRMKLAAELLAANERLRVEEIAGLLGYNEARRFRRLFKRRFGMPPSEFRRAHDTKAPPH